MIISIDAEKAFDKVPHPFMIKTLAKVGAAWEVDWASGTEHRRSLHSADFSTPNLLFGKKGGAIACRPASPIEKKVEILILTCYGRLILKVPF